MGNPLKKGNVGATLPAGSYNFALISIDEKQQQARKGYKTADGKFVSEPIPGVMEPILSFRFATTHNTLGDAFASSRVRPFVSAKSKLVKLLRELAPGEMTEEDYRNMDLVWKFANSLVGRQFLISIVPNGEYNNIQAIVPMPAGQGSAPKKITQVVGPGYSEPPADQRKAAFVPPERMPQAAEDGSVTFDDDDIPF